MIAKPQRGGIGRHRSAHRGRSRRSARQRLIIYPATTLAGLLLVSGVHQPMPAEHTPAGLAEHSRPGDGPQPRHPGQRSTVDFSVPGVSPVLAASYAAGTYAMVPAAFGVPATVLDAYRRAAAAMAQSEPGCRLDWTLLAGIGKVESGHARGGDVAANGDVLHPILGPVLDGSAGTAAVPNTMGAVWGQSGPWSRAVGPMQFLPSTWQRWGGNGNPENVYDAALAAARYLCSGGGDLSTPGGQANAIFSYNHSAQYVALVEQWMRVYQAGGAGIPDQPGQFDLSGFIPPASSGQDDTVPPQPPAPSTGPISGPVTTPPGAPSRPPSPPAPTNPPKPAPGGGKPQPGPILPVLGSVPVVVGAVLAPVASVAKTILPLLP